MEVKNRVEKLDHMKSILMLFLSVVYSKARASDSPPPPGSHQNSENACGEPVLKQRMSVESACSVEKTSTCTNVAKNLV